MEYSGSLCAAVLFPTLILMSGQVRKIIVFEKDNLYSIIEIKRTERVKNENDKKKMWYEGIITKTYG